jgi:hypothetical protein
MHASLGALLVVALSGCGGLVVFNEGGGGAEVAAPPLSATCEAAVAAIDWSPCDAVLSFHDARAHFASSCENRSNTRACAELTEAYYRCVAEQGGACVATVDPRMGSALVGVPIAACEDARLASADCASTCGAPSQCPEDASCECLAPSPLEGAECCWYPSCPEDGSVPNCYALCETCPG